MRRKSVAFVLTCVVISSAFAQDDELDVTMRVLDDVSEIDGVLLSIDNELDSDVGDEQATDREKDVDQNDSDDGAAGVDAEDDGQTEGELGERDVAEEEAEDPVDETGQRAEVEI